MAAHASITSRRAVLGAIATAPFAAAPFWPAWMTAVAELEGADAAHRRALDSYGVLEAAFFRNAPSRPQPAAVPRSGI